MGEASNLPTGFQCLRVFCRHGQYESRRGEGVGRTCLQSLALGGTDRNTVRFQDARLYAIVTTFYIDKRTLVKPKFIAKPVPERTVLQKEVHSSPLRNQGAFWTYLVNGFRTRRQFPLTDFSLLLLRSTSDGRVQRVGLSGENAAINLRDFLGLPCGAELLQHALASGFAHFSAAGRII